MTRALRATVAALVLVCNGQALAETGPIRHGLWQHNFTMKTQSGEMEKQWRQAQELLANMPPEQRRMMEQTMASHGLSMGPDGQSIQVCISREKAAQGVIPQQDGDCTYEVTERRDNGLSMTFTCNTNPPSSGESEVTFNSPTHYTGRSVINTTVNGQPEIMTVEQSGEWLSYDCGNLRPQ